MDVDQGVVDKGKYERHTIITMELMSSYFVNIFYNELFVIAKQKCEAREAPTITHGYKHALQAWLNGLNKPHLYKRTIRGLYDYYMCYTSYIKSWDDCIDDMAREFVPQGYIESLTKTQKMCILSTVIKQSNLEFIKCIVMKHFPIIIDSHTADNAQVIKEEMIGILLLERERMYQKFIVQAASTSTADQNAPDKNVIDRLQRKLKDVLLEKFELNRRLIRMRNYAKTLLRHMKAAKSKETLPRVPSYVEMEPQTDATSSRPEQSSFVATAAETPPKPQPLQNQLTIDVPSEYDMRSERGKALADIEIGDDDQKSSPIQDDLDEIKALGEQSSMVTHDNMDIERLAKDTPIASPNATPTAVSPRAATPRRKKPAAAELDFPIDEMDMLIDDY